MPRSSKAVACTYLKMDGTYCGASCFGGICYAHAKRGTVRNRCGVCGRMTISPSGFCSRAGACTIAGNRQNAIMGKERKEPTRKVYVPITDEELGELVDELLDTMEAVS